MTELKLEETKQSHFIIFSLVMNLEQMTLVVTTRPSA